MKPQITDEERRKLLAQREELVKKIEDLKLRGVQGRTQAAMRFYKEDLTALAHKIVLIDRKLGRIE